jgi:Zn finger protein HypA/HybF involved in hydrogenase expression
MTGKQNWTIVLRCYQCSGRFTIAHMPFQQLTSVPLIAACPHCGAYPQIVAAQNESQVHRIFDLRSDRAQPTKSAA